MKSATAKVVILGLVGASFLFGGVAQGASVTGPVTAVTSSGIKSLDYYNQQARYKGANTRSISGTASGLTDQAVDLVCLDSVTGNIDSYLSRGVTVTSGKWATSADIGYLSGYNCRLAALPSGTSPSGDTNAARIASTNKFAGPKVQLVTYWEYGPYVTGELGGLWNFDIGVSTVTNKVYYEIWGSQDGGLYSWGTVSDGTANSRTGLLRSAGAYLYERMNGPSNTYEPGILIDNVQAFPAYNMNSSSNGATAANSPKYKYSYDKNGVLTYTETQSLFKCTSPESNTTVYRDLSYCPDYKVTKLNVNFVRVTTMSADGTVAKVSNTFNSLDSKAHSVKYAEYWQLASANSKVRYATTGAFGDLDADVANSGTARSNLSGTGIKSDPSSATSVTNPILQLVYVTKPTKTWTAWTTGIYSQWSQSISAGKGKSVTITTGATMITSDSEASAKIAAASKK